MLSTVASSIASGSPSNDGRPHEATQHPVHHGRPDGRALAAHLQLIPHQDAALEPPGRTGGSVRRCVLQQPAVRTLALHPGQRATAQPHWCLRQRCGFPSRRAHLCSLPASPGLSHRALWQDAFLWARPTARLRRTTDQRHLPGRLRLGRELGRTRPAPELVPQHVLGTAGRALRAHQPTGFR